MHRGDPTRPARGPNRGSFRPSFDRRRRRGFSAAECRRGYQAALDAAWGMDAALVRWLASKVRGWYRADAAGRPFDWTPAARRARMVGSPRPKESVQ